MTAEETVEDKRIFKDISADGDPEITEVDSLCMNCHEEGKTRLLLTRIPFFKDVIVSSFSCDNCSYQNNEVQTAGPIQENGVTITVLIDKLQELNRQVVRSTKCTVRIPSIDFEIPPCRGELTTVESLLTTSASELEQQQPVRRVMDPELATKIDEFVSKLKLLAEVKEPFEVILTDPSGNSFVQNPHAPKKDTNMKIDHFVRTREQNESLGLIAEDAPDVTETEAESTERQPIDFTKEVVSFHVNCSHCNSPAESNMKLVDIPHFKQVILMAFNCEYCGYRDNEVKGGMAIEEKGCKMTLHVTDPSDLNRDILKSDASGLEIPEIDFVATEGTLGGRFTTLEGLLDNINESLGSNNAFATGDSADDDSKTNMSKFLQKVENLKTSVGWTFILDDPTGNSYIQNLYAPDDDPEITIEHYVRSHEQNEDLGLLDMKTENYETS